MPKGVLTIRIENGDIESLQECLPFDEGITIIAKSESKKEKIN